MAGGWDGRISIISAAHGGMYASFAAHNNRWVDCDPWHWFSYASPCAHTIFLLLLYTCRIKCLEAFLLPEGYGAMVVSGDADGSIKVTNAVQEGQPKPFASSLVLIAPTPHANASRSGTSNKRFWSSQLRPRRAKSQRSSTWCPWHRSVLARD